MINQKALSDFQGALDIVDELLKLESGYNDPPSSTEMNIVLGLRSSASVLMMGLFEFYLREVIAEIYRN
ncbi:MAG: hypothetical protein ABR985_16080 [Methanotrichaceae archaeon]